MVKAGRRARISGPMIACGIVLMMFVSTGFLRASSPGAGETEAIEKAVREYFDAEMREDYKAVYGMLAPSSFYAKAHTYEEYLVEARAIQVRVVTYRIIRIGSVRENTDRQSYPNVQAFAAVEVEAVLFHRDIQSYETINFDFTFIKEGNRWFKG